MKIPKQFSAFRQPKLLYVDPKRVDLDHTLINLFMRLDHNGSHVSIDKTHPVDPHTLREAARRQGAVLRNFVADDELAEVTTRWLESDLLNIISQGTRKGKIAAPRPLHLDSYKLRNTAQARDYNTSEQLYTMIVHADKELVEELRQFLGQTPKESRPDQPYGQLDIAALTLYYLAQTRTAAPYRDNTYEPPLFPNAAALMCDDLRRLLAYRQRMPRAAIVDYLRMLLGFHLGLYVLRLMEWLPRWLAQAEAQPAQDAITLVVDVGERPDRHMAELARASVRYYLDRLPDYVRATFAFNQLLDYAKRRQPTPTQVFALLKERNDPLFRSYFQIRLDDLLQGVNDTSEFEPIQHAPLDDFDKLIEMITYARLSFHREYLIQLLDALLQKNKDEGLMRQGLGRGLGAQRRFYLGSRLLEALVQLAVLQRVPGLPHRFETHPILIDDFIDWLRTRYGILLNPLSRPGGATSGDDYPAYRDNLAALKQRLREIGFYTDLSDAYNAQTIQPRYSLA